MEVAAVETTEGRRGDGYVKEFTRHADDVLLNLNELRRRGVLTDATLVVGGARLQAHCAVLVACSGFFYSLYSHRGERMSTVSLPATLEPSSVRLLLDFMYTSRLPLSSASVAGVLAAATYLQMDHVADACREFMRLRCSDGVSARDPQLEPDSRVASVSPKRGDLPTAGPQQLYPTPTTARLPVATGAPLGPGTSPGPRGPRAEPVSPLAGAPTSSPGSPARSSCQPSSPAESSTCSKNLAPDPKACNWKKYKYIVLNPLCAAAAAVKVEETEEAQASPTADRVGSTAPTEAWPGEVPGQIDRQGRASCYEGSGRAPPLAPPPSVPPVGVEQAVSPGAVYAKLLPSDPEAARHRQPPVKREAYFAPYGYSGGPHGAKTACSGDKPYRCNVCGAQFNRPANLKTHARIHSGEKPYRCDTCGARFVQVAHLRAHVLIHTGEKPYPCHTCGTRFRHLQTLKSHMRIHTGEKPYTCEKCDLHFRHKSQLRLHLRQKHGAVTNTKIRYKVLSEAYQPLLQAC